MNNTFFNNRVLALSLSAGELKHIIERLETSKANPQIICELKKTLANALDYHMEAAIRDLSYIGCVAWISILEEIAYENKMVVENNPIMFKILDYLTEHKVELKDDARLSTDD